jgi:hypothetical protein
MLPPRILTVTIGPAGTGGQSWSGPMRIEADVDLESGSKPNKAKVKIHNLGPGALSWIEQSGNSMQVLAGEGVASQLFLGDVSRYGVTTKKEKSGGLVTEIEARDGGRRYGEAKFSRSYPAGTARDLILTDVLAALRLPIGYRSPSLAPFALSFGYSFSGRASDALAELMAADLSNYTIQGGAVYMFAPGDGTLPGVSPILSDSTGLMGSPERKEKGAVSCVCRLQPAFNRCGMGFTLQSSWLSGMFKVDSVKHSAISDGSKWQTTVVGKALAA